MPETSTKILPVRKYTQHTHTHTHTHTHIHTNKHHTRCQNPQQGSCLSGTRWQELFCSCIFIRQCHVPGQLKLPPGFRRHLLISFRLCLHSFTFTTKKGLVKHFQKYTTKFINSYFFLSGFNGFPIFQMLS